MVDPLKRFGEPAGPWSHQHSGVAVGVAMLVVALVTSIWPGWDWLRAWLGST